ncbi:MAG: hypothetical protein ACRECW_15250 [Phyllobacterium sp.]
MALAAAAMPFSFAHVAAAQGSVFSVCHGYGCYYRTKVGLSASDQAKIARIMKSGARSAAEERAVVRKAVQVFESRSTAVIGVRDGPKSEFGQPRRKGQMDCVDESTNTDHFLRYLQSRGLLKYHRVGRRAARGLFIDGRYPHNTGVLKDRNGVSWAIDSWYEPAGGPPDVMPLSEWKKRGVNGQR